MTLPEIAAITSGFATAVAACVAAISAFLIWQQSQTQRQIQSEVLVRDLFFRYNSFMADHRKRFQLLPNLYVNPTLSPTQKVRQIREWWFEYRAAHSVMRAIQYDFISFSERSKGLVHSRMFLVMEDDAQLARYSLNGALDLCGDFEKEHPEEVRLLLAMTAENWRAEMSNALRKHNMERLDFLGDVDFVRSFGPTVRSFKEDLERLGNVLRDKSVGAI